MKDEFKVGDRVCSISDRGYAGRIVAMSEHDCYVSWNSSYCTWVDYIVLEKAED